jgi:molecular chaperone GrpE
MNTETSFRNNPAATGDEADEVERLKDDVRREHEMYLRALADFDNYRRRVERDRASAARAWKKELLLSLLEVTDSFDRALDHVGDAPDAFVEGLQAIHRKILSLLEAQGVTPIDSLGQPFDPELHEAVGSVVSDEYEAGTIVDEVQRGYLWGEELLRPPRVGVTR